MKKVIQVSVAFGVAVAMFSATPQAIAATTDEISNVIIKETLQSLNVEITDQELLDSLTEDLNYALEENLIDQNVINLTLDSIDNGSELDLDDTQNSIEEDLNNNWIESEAALKVAFDKIKLEFQACREQAVQSTRECALGLGFKFQFAMTEQLILQGQELEASLENLTGEELLQAQNELIELNQLIENRITRIDSKLAKFEELKNSTPALISDISKLKQLKAQANDQIRESQPVPIGKEDGDPSAEPSAEPSEQSSKSKLNDSQKGNSGNGNAQNGGNSNRGNIKK